ncbi:pseudoazurin [Silicimonas algicola]|uniref:Pseudoazurin n=2 Tax=Silicimonas algicola TaxID=1826607 RepID=A0A316G467_9RHOB|nr:pseudoazurin [Silicimonas algicola]
MKTYVYKRIRSPTRTEVTRKAHLMFTKVLIPAAALALLAGVAAAETYTVEMLNRGEAGAMVFEPAFLQAQPGDTITFVPTDRSHNSATIGELLPEGAEPWDGAINEEVTVTLTEEGLYAYQCDPHAAMGMVGLIQVGAPTNLEEVTAAADDLRGKAKNRMTELLTQVTE